MNTSASKGIKHMAHSEIEVFVACVQYLMPFEKSEKFKNLRGRITDNHRLGKRRGSGAKRTQQWRRRGQRTLGHSFLDA